MNSFFNCQERVFGTPLDQATQKTSAQPKTQASITKSADEICEDALLEAFKK